MADKSLKAQLEGVTADPPPAESKPAEEPGKERTMDEVRGELLRKQEKSNSEIRREIADLSGQIKTLVRPPENPKPQTNDSLENYSVAQLEALRPQVPEENKPLLEKLIIDKTVAERVDQKLSDYSHTQSFDQKRVSFGQVAVDRFPDLGNAASDFSLEVEKRLREEPEMNVRNNPRLTLDIANDVAHTQGVAPQMRRTVSGFRPSSSGTKPVEDEKPAPKLSDKEREKMIKTLSKGMPKGKTFNQERIDERTAHYDKHLKDHVKG